MAEDEESASMAASSSRKEAPLCEECGKNPSKYKCPGCSIRTCCLSCVKAHKERTACAGKKQFNDVVPLSQFDDNLLLSDYNMLEEVKRVAESGRRMRLKLSSNFRLPFPLKSLQKAAAIRNTKLLFLSSGMSKRVKNQTYYNYRKKDICWTIEWRFHSAVVLMDHGVHENRSLLSVIENHLKPGPWRNQMRKFCEQPLDSLKFFIRKYAKGRRSPYRELNLRGSIREQLANLSILEYPVIHVFLPSQSYDFEVIEDANPCRKEVVNKVAVKSEEVCQPGVYFRVEEIEEDGSPHPHDSCVMTTSKMDTEFSTSLKEARSDETTLDENCDSRKLLPGTIQSSTLASCGNDELDFDKGLADDAYGDLIAQTNSDVAGFLPQVFVDEELEEGEIA